MNAAEAPAHAFWTRTPRALATELGSGVDGLTSAQAASALARYGPNADAAARRVGLPLTIGKRFLEPLALILIAAALLSGFTGDVTSAAIIVSMLVLSIGLDTLQERRAMKAAEVLRQSVAVRTEAKRDGAFVEVTADAIVPGDVIRVRAGDIVPADALILEASGFTAGEAALTGEPYPVEKRAGPVEARTASEAVNAVFRGSVAQTGEAVALVAATGRATVFGGAASVLAEDAAPSPFQRDLRALGFMIMRLTVLLVIVVLIANLVFGRPLVQSLLFAIALAVGLTPELLPMITTVTLARGAVRLAARKVIVKRLASIHDLGAMTVFCTDKTGTLTSAEISVSKSLGPDGAEAPRAATLAAVCAGLGGDRGALDAALAKAHPEACQGWTSLARVAFDFKRRIGSVLAQGPDGRLLIVKGAPEAVLPRSTLSDAARARATALVREMAEQGLRTVAVASRAWDGAPASISHDDEHDLVFEGLVAFADPPKASAKGAIARLAAAGVKVKILSGDDPVVVKRLAGLVGLKADTVLSGAEIADLSADALKVRVRHVDAFARLAPDQKSRIVHALQANGEIVGFMGDGINDAPGLKTADIGLSVDGASGVAREAADMILLDADLQVVADGVAEGRRTFANILKYVRMGASSNFGNMLSMAAASMLLPFLPMLPTQILLNNLLYDVSEVGIPLDNVSDQEIAKPETWNMTALLKFAGVMGPLSSVFDLLTFGGLYWLFHESPAVFRTGWFLESMATQILVIFLIRTRGPIWASRPHMALAASSLGALAVALVLPFTPVGAWFGFTPPPPLALLALAGIVAAYLGCVEVVKPWIMGKAVSGVSGTVY